MGINFPGTIKTTQAAYSAEAQTITKDLKTTAAAMDSATAADEDVNLQIDNGADFDDTVNSTEDLSKATAEELLEKKQLIENTIAKLEAEVEKLEQKLEAKNQEIEELNQQYEKETTKLEEYEEDFDKKQNKLADLNEEIASTQQYEQKRFDGKISDITKAAIDDYDPEKHGDDFNAYISEQLSGVGLGNFSALDFLNSEAVSLADDVNGLMGNIKKQAGTVRTLANQITSAQADASSLQKQIEGKNGEIATQKTQFEAVRTQLAKLDGSGLTAGEVLAQISDSEKALVTSNNIDLTEKLEDGSPKYIAAKGEDGNFHFYEMTSSGSATSLARKYGSDTGGLRGSDIVPSGSGYMNGITDVEPGNGRAVYSFSEVNECLTDGEACSTQKCYTTCSPLSFDVDGNGVNTTASTMRYDIDGDGELDTINNSAEWVLAFDKDGNGIAGENGSELFGDNTDLDGDGVKDGFANGFEALKALAKKENLIDGKTDNKLDANDLKHLQEKYGLVMTNGYGGEAKSLEDLGITEINLAQTDETTLTKNFDGRHNNIMRQEGATFKVNGQTREYADIWNAKLDSSSYDSENDYTSSKNRTIKVDLDSALSFLEKADSLTASFAHTRDVDYTSSVIANKTDAKLQESSVKAKFEEAKQAAEEEAKQENFMDENDDDFIAFQKKKIK